ncbi:hypothetical protein N7466_001338 [Penicillium verhagenii]|uniref:uncharacterized protein n=1 Tax=Penicillium verhagenii TaxID=1562060 RepID=UPI002545AAF0|nr:uncharacterized protein N7466_001338 [Penicillium verhagenii]KAJ5948323.1 hypothetical protein N7466_001338 [Penicillium verhagenii]
MRIALKHFLFKVNEVDSDLCDCLEGSQTPQNILLRYPRFVDERKDIMGKICARPDLSANLPDYEALVSHPHATRYVV